MTKKALKFLEAIAFIVDKVTVPDDEWDEQEWADEEYEVETRAFFSSRVENARFLDRAKGFLGDRIQNITEETPGGTALKAGGRADFVRDMRDFMVKEGMAKQDEFRDARGVTDIRSEARLKLIYDTNLRQAYGYGEWKQGQTPAILESYPAQRFRRSFKVTTPRPLHVENDGEVRLKSDVDFWLEMNNEEIGGFNVPWGPWGFNSGMGIEDVDREEAIKLGLKVDDVEPTKGELNDNLTYSTKTMDDDVKAKLRKELEAFKLARKKFIARGDELGIR